MAPPKSAADELVGSLMGEIFVLPHYKPTIGGNDTISLARDPSNVCDEEAIRVDSTNELVGYLEHKDPCVLRNLLDRELIRIHGFVPEIAPAELHGVIVPCQIHVYSKKKDFKTVKSAITSVGLQFLSLSIDNKQKGVDSSAAKSSVGKKQKGVNQSTAKKEKVLGANCGIFHNKSSTDVWDYIEKNKLQDPADMRYVICDENLKMVFNGKPRVMIPDFESLIHFLVYNDKLVDGVNRSTAKKGKVLGANCGIFHNKSSSDVWDYIEKNKLQDPADKRYVICDENLKMVFNGKPRVMIPDFGDLIHFLAYNDKLVDPES